MPGGGIVMSANVVSGLFAIIGAVIGAVAAALTQIIQTVSQNRARRAEMKAEAAAQKKANWLGVIDQLIRAANSACLSFLAWRRSADTDPNVMGRNNEEALKHLNEIEMNVTWVRRGTERANDIAAKLQADMRAWLDQPLADRFTTEKLTDAIKSLQQAEDDLSALYRQEERGD